MTENSTALLETAVSDDLQAAFVSRASIMPGGLSSTLLQELPPASSTSSAKRLPTKRIFRDRDEVMAAIASAPQTMRPWAGEEGPRWRITVSPGSIQIGTKDYAKIAASSERAVQRALRQNVGMTVAEVEVPPVRTSGGLRGKVRDWSRQSRARMVRRLCTFDYLPLFAGEHPPALVTLTLPHDWEKLAPTGQAFKRIINRWASAWRVKWSSAPVAVWKMEFQYRVACAEAGCHDPRAPHVHLLMRLPDVPIAEFQEWLSRSWTRAVRPSKAVVGGRRDVVAHRVAAEGETPCDCSEWCRHLSAGTGVDIEETLRYGDAKRVAVYFTKHGSFASKEYQNHLPDLWADDEKGVNFWGYWGLEVVEGVLETDPELAAFAARVLRHVHDSQRYSERIPGSENELDPHRRSKLGRTREVWRSSKLPADLAALPDDVLEGLVSGNEAEVEQTPDALISAIMSA